MNGVGVPRIIELNNFLVLMAKGTIHQFDHKADYSEAVKKADEAAADGFSCVVIDLQNRSEVYQMNPWMLQNNIPYLKVPYFATVADYLKFERAQIAHEVLSKVGEIPQNQADFSNLMAKAKTNGDFLPRLSGQTPTDATKDY